MPSPMSGEDTLDKILIDCIRFGVRTSQDLYYGKPVIRIGQFDFGVHAHSTGNGVSVDLWNADRTKKFNIISATYWFSNHYTHNDSKWINGAWDSSLDESIKTLETESQAAKALSLEKENKLKEERLAREKAEIGEFESQFLVKNVQINDF